MKISSIPNPIVARVVCILAWARVAACVAVCTSVVVSLYIHFVYWSPLTSTLVVFVKDVGPQFSYRGVRKAGRGPCSVHATLTVVPVCRCSSGSTLAPWQSCCFSTLALPLFMAMTRSKPLSSSRLRAFSMMRVHVPAQSGVAHASVGRGVALAFFRLGVACWAVHYAKRLFETFFVHRFSRPTMPLTNLFKNCGYYWSFTVLVRALQQRVVDSCPRVMVVVVRLVSMHRLPTFCATPGTAHQPRWRCSPVSPCSLCRRS